MGYFINLSGDREAFALQASDRASFRKYLGYKGIYTHQLYPYHTHELEEKYKDEFATWLALKRMEVRWWDIL